MEDRSGRSEPDRDRSPCVEAVGGVGGSERPIPAWLGSNGTAALTVSRDVYSKKAVLAAAYKFSDRCAILIDTDERHNWLLLLVGAAADDLELLLEALIRELGDQALREQLETEFGPVRTLIVAQAFAEGNLLDVAQDESNADRHSQDTGPDR